MISWHSYLQQKEGDLRSTILFDFIRTAGFLNFKMILKAAVQRSPAPYRCLASHTSHCGTKTERESYISNIFKLETI